MTEAILNVRTAGEKKKAFSSDRSLAGRVHLLRRQRKAVLENCRRIVVIGASSDPNSRSFVSMEKLMGLGLEIVPVVKDRETLLGARCFPKLSDVPGSVDIVQFYPGGGADLVEAALDAVEKKVAAFWIEQDMAGSEEVEEILGNGKIQLVEHECLEAEYIKHFPAPPAATKEVKNKMTAARVADRMTRNPATVKPRDGIKDALQTMERGHFRHLPVVDDGGKLVGMLSDRDIRLIRPSLAFVSREEAMVQLWSIAVQQAAVFDPIAVKPETTLAEATQLMLRWHVGGLPVIDDQERLVGVITYTDLLREFAAQSGTV